MKSLFLAIALIFTAVETQAGWRYQRHDNYYSTRADDLGNVDPYYYFQSAGGVWCRSNYRLPAAVQAQAVQYNKNWKENLVNALHAKSESEQFRAALAESGLASPNGYAQGQQSTGNYSSLSVIQQGASTLYGPQQATVSPFGSYDPMAVANMLNKSAESSLSVSQQLNTGLAATNAQVLAAQQELERIKLAQNAIIAASQTNQTITTQTTHSSAGTSTNGASTQSVADRHPNALAMVEGEVLFKQNCLICHGGTVNGQKVVKGNLDLSDLSAIQNRDEFSEQAWKLMNHRDESKRMPAGKAKLSAPDAGKIFAFLRGD